MNLPTFLVGMNILLWGWQTDWLPLAVPMALLLGSRPWVGSRWEWDMTAYQRLANLTVLVLIATAGFAFFLQRGTHPLILLLRLLPLASFPLIAFLSFAPDGPIPLDLLFRTAGKRGDRSRSLACPQETLLIAYAGLCLISAGAGVDPAPVYFPAGTLLLLGLLWGIRSRRYQLGIWLFLALLLAGGGYGVQWGLSTLQRNLLENYAEWFVQFFSGDRDPFRVSTALGRIGSLKDTPWILFRVERPGVALQPLLLREGVYQYFDGSTWTAAGTRFRTISPGIRPGHWTLPGRSHAHEQVTIHRSLSRESNLIPLPTGALEIIDLPVEQLELSQYGVAKGRGAEGYLSYRVEFDPGAITDAEPNIGDFNVPPREAPALERVLRDAKIEETQPPMEKLRRLENYFRHRFRYSLELTEPPPGVTPTADFLLTTRAGHCELFATSTVLLLRQAGIAARYVIGYSVQEFSPGENLYLVRQNHMHAWVSAHLDGHWQEVDTTPPDWAAKEANTAPWWQPLGDSLARLLTQFEVWRMPQEGREHGQWAGLGTAAAAGLLGWFLWRSRGKFRIRRESGETRTTASEHDTSLAEASPFARVIAELARNGETRPPGEPLLPWLQRGGHHSLLPLVRLHYRLRFNPGDQETAIRQQLGSEIDRLLTNR
ncbi:MAG: transglutaminase family protein [Magnetococcales bacterium]|nr:transglutaminase family protein [Magnetococcales bacterium]